MFEPIKKKALSTEVYEQLRDHIVAGTVGPGDFLPSERILSDRLGVNRAAIREGLKRLEQAGLIAIQQGGPTRVLDYRRSGGLGLLAAMLVDKDQHVRTGVVRSIIEMRRSMAPEVARFAARRASSQQIQALRYHVQQMKDSKEELMRLQDLAMTFWGVLVESGSNIAFQLAYHSLEATYGKVQRQLVHVLELELTATERYEALAEAVATGHEEAASVQAAAIVRLGSDALEEVLGALDTVRVVQ